MYLKSFKLRKGLHWMGPQWFIILCVFEVEEVSGVRTGGDYMLALLWRVLATVVKWLYGCGVFVCTQIYYFRYFNDCCSSPSAPLSSSMPAVLGASRGTSNIYNSHLYL